ncbi:unnamed protein product [Cuscuta campestris]|uniref:Reticulon-like protein n=1 Tax=Cuscuta campestris TaxID=132261 RepID=A0A484K2I1_9ASTE|nr:unnamed protein product [Cuscuta campestris]
MNPSSSSSRVRLPSPPLHSRSKRMLGGGNVADLLLWKNKQVSAAMVIGVTLVWFLLEVEEFTVVSLLSYLSIFAMALLFLWSTASSLFDIWSPPDLEDVAIPESTIKWLFGKLNKFLLTFYEVASGKDLRKFILAITVLWILSVIGNYFNFLNLVYTGFICLATIPAIYERYESDVNRLASKGYEDFKVLYEKSGLKAQFDKIPKKPLKQRKIA